MSKPNVVWFFADELRVSALGCYQQSWRPVWTPNIDSLAARGVRFENSFCTSPVCVPSRHSIMTSHYPESTGIYANQGAWKSFPLPVLLPTFPEHFAAHGYRTVSFGKTHLHPSYAPWQESCFEGASMHEFGLEADPTLEPIMPKGIPSPIGGVSPSEKQYTPEKVTWNALKWLDHHASGGDDTPFLLRVSYLQPHTPVLPPAHYRRLYRARDWPGHNLPRGYGSMAEEAFAAAAGGRELSHEQMQQAQADYHALVSWLDTQVGLVLGALANRGLLENTILVFTADHGASLGEDGLISKDLFVPQCHRVPLIVTWSGVLPAHEVRSDLAQGIDLGPTLVDLAGLPRLPKAQGRALFGDPEPDEVYGTVNFGHYAGDTGQFPPEGWPQGGSWPRRSCVRTRRYRLDLNVRQDGQPVPPEREDIFLADVEADPKEMHNLAKEPAQADLVASLRAKVLAHAANSVEPQYIPSFSPDESPEFLPAKVLGYS
ncbi:sulfatase-like hydrolase/transferase [Devosia sp.]|uniref:sulfatase family protein n=1 Tax=Devosia sp. TaxID=1871048 RepID=UPI0025B9C69C|nr:sulfatase-like hydrolase/transferase [Devosia sp.]